MTTTTAPARRRRHPRSESRLDRCAALALALTAAALAAGCSPSRFVASSLGDALAQDSLVYAGESDIELVGAAVPFGLKTMESLLVEVPDHRGLLTATARGFTQYAYVFVQLPADELEDRDVAAAYEQRARARKLYLRARDYGLRGLGFHDQAALERLHRDPQSAIAHVGTEDLETLYWTTLAWSAAISLGKDHPALIADLPLVDALVDRATALDPDFDAGGLHTFMIAYTMGQPGAGAEALETVSGHFQRAVELSEGARAAPFVSMAESVAIPRGERRAFETLLDRALSIDADARPEWRLANHVMQHRARWLLARKDAYFLE